MNMTLSEGLGLAGSVIKNYQGKDTGKAEVILCVPYIHLAPIAELTKESKVLCGAQNCASEISGAFTGEISAQMIKSTGADCVIIGHSERRTIFREDDQILNKKIRLAIAAGLRVIFCCGELLPEREANVHFDTVKKQVQEGLFNLSDAEFSNIIIAYEPVWAIGTGLTASPEQAQEMHSYIRQLIAGKFGNEAAETVSILYGGSCKPSNASEIFAKPDVDGGLIGGASLKSDDFCAIVDAAL